MNYNPKITPLTISVGPAAAYYEPTLGPQVSQIPQIRQVQPLKVSCSTHCQQNSGAKRFNAFRLFVTLLGIFLILSSLVVWFVFRIGRNSSNHHRPMH